MNFQRFLKLTLSAVENFPYSFLFFISFICFVICFKSFVSLKVLKLKPNDWREQYGYENKVGVKLFEPIE